MNKKIILYFICLLIYQSFNLKLFAQNDLVSISTLSGDTSITFIYNHQGTGAYAQNKIIGSLPGYYIAGINYKCSGNGCGWCYPSRGRFGARVWNFGHNAQLYASCDGQPAKIEQTVVFSKYRIDPAIIKIVIDPGNTIDQFIFAQNDANYEIQLVYKHEWWNGSIYQEAYRGITIPAHEKKIAVSKFVMVDGVLFPSRVTSLFTIKDGPYYTE